ncbi:hypothetical protein ONS96_002480 [Cadophora gregata f. sp. sojae]|nr:hypothetical protein ONS96_002480 [Cadophora gregata f. sp. sojae]
MRSTILYTTIAAHSVLASAMYRHQLQGRQVDDSEPDPAGLYLLQMCRPDFYNTIMNSTYKGQLFPYLALSPFPCDQADYILGSCLTNATDPAVDFDAEQQCLCGSNIIDAWKGCSACYNAHGWPGYNSSVLIEDASFISSIFTAECTASPYPTVPFANFMNITTITTTLPRITLGEDKFPNQTAASNYWTTDLHVTPTIGVITGVATGRASERTAPWEYYTPSGSVRSSSATGLVASGAGTTPAPSGSGSGSGSAAGVSTSLSTAGAGDLGSASGVVFVVVNVVAVMLL